MIDNLLEVIKFGDNKKFYQINNEYITYNVLLEKVLELSNNLKKQGNAPIIIYGHKSVETVIAILSCVVAKRCYIPLDVHIPKERISEIIEESKASLLIKAEDLELSDIENYTINEINKKYYDKKDYFTNNNKIAYIIFTSGSTGKAKGVPITYDNLNSFIKWIINTKELKKINNITVLSEASFSFDLSVMDIYFSLYKNLSIVAVDKNTKKDLNKLLHIIKKEKINFLIMTPTFCKMLLLDKKFNSSNFSNIKYMFFCGESLEVEIVKKIKDRFSDLHILNAYGPTEATCCISLIEIDNKMLNEKYLPVGKINTCAVNIEIDNDEIILKGESVFDRYLNVSSENSYKENNINCFKTGDVGYIKGDNLYCIGRKDNQIKYMGYRIELGDIENNLLKIEGINEAVVVAIYKENTNIVKLIKAFITTNKSLTDDYIKKELAKFVPVYMIPKVIKISDKLPTTNNNKYDRRTLQKL